MKQAPGKYPTFKAGSLFTEYPVGSKGPVKFLKTYSFILEYENYGLMIFDTGAKEGAETMRSYLKSKFKADPEDVKWVFITHVHPDHTGNAHLFTNAQIIVSKADLKASIHVAHGIYPDFISSIGDFNQWSKDVLGTDSRLGFLEDDLDLPKLITSIHTPGHTMDHYAYKIDAGPCNIMVTGDAMSNRLKLKNSDREHRGEPHIDMDQYNQWLDFFSTFEGIFVPGHDRPFYSHNFRTVPENPFTEAVCELL